MPRGELLVDASPCHRVADGLDPRFLLPLNADIITIGDAEWFLPRLPGILWYSLRSGPGGRKGRIPVHVRQGPVQIA